MKDNRKTEMRLEFERILQEQFETAVEDYIDTINVNCCCENHKDDRASLTVTYDRAQDKILIFCHGCNSTNPRGAYNVLKNKGFKVSSAPKHIVWHDEATKSSVFFEKYLATRGVENALVPESLKEHNGIEHPDLCDDDCTPALIHAVTDTHENLCGVHVTFLDGEFRDKLDCDSPKRSYGKCSGHHIKIRTGTNDILHVGEGIENIVAVGTYLPEECEQDSIWASGNANFLKALRIPNDRFKVVHIWADNDINGVGQSAANSLIDRLRCEDIICYLHLPKNNVRQEHNVDWLDCANERTDEISESFYNVEAIEPFHADEKRIMAESPWQGDGIHIPDNYEIHHSGVYENVTNAKGITTRIWLFGKPIWVNRIYRPVDGSESLIELRYWNHSHRNWDSRIIPVDALSHYRNLQTELLAGNGITVNAENTRKALNYLSKCYESSTQVAKLSTKVGWVDLEGGKKVFCGVDDDVLLHGDRYGFANRYKKITSKGSLVEWQEHVLKPISLCKGASLMMAFGLTAPLLRFVHASYFSVVLGDSPDGGKSIAANAALSVWGEPSGLTASAKSTYVGIHNDLAFIHDLPFAIEDTQRLSSEEVCNLLYDVANPEQRDKGSRDRAGIVTSDPYKTILFLPAEFALLETLRLDGANLRAVEIQDVPLAELQDVDARTALSKNIRSYYGVLGPQVVERYRRANADGTLIELFDVCSQEFELPKNTSILNRMRPRFGAVLTALRLLVDYLGEEIELKLENYLKDYWRTLADTKTRTLLPYRALGTLLDHVESYPKYYQGKKTLPVADVFGRFLDEDENHNLAMIYNRLEDVFKDKYTLKAVLTEWKRRHWLYIEPSKRSPEHKNLFTARARLDPDTNSKRTCVVIRREVIEQFRENTLAEGSIAPLPIPVKAKKLRGK